MFSKLAIKFLNELGYCPIAYPYSTFEPMDLLYREKKSLVHLGPVSHIIAETTEKKPKIEKDIKAPDISGKLTSDLDFTLGITAMNELLTAIGASGVGIEVGFRPVKSFTFNYKNVLRDTMGTLFDMADYLGGAVPNMDYMLIDYFDERKEAYIVQDVLKSNSFSVTSKDDKGYNIDIDIANIQGILSVHPNIKVTKTGEYTVSFEGDTYFNFALMAKMIWVSKKNGSFKIEISDSPLKAVAKKAPQRVADPIMQEGALISIIDRSSD